MCRESTGKPPPPPLKLLVMRKVSILLRHHLTRPQVCCPLNVFYRCKNVCNEWDLLLTGLFYKPTSLNCWINNLKVGHIVSGSLGSNIYSVCLGATGYHVLFWCWVWLCVPFTNPLMVGVSFPLPLILIDIFRLSESWLIWFCNYAPPQMFVPLDLGFEYWIEHVIFGLLCVMFRFSTRIIYRGVSGFATDCPCGVLCHGITTCLLYVGPLFRNLFSMK